MSLDPLSIATRGYVCGGNPDPIAIATLGYVCLADGLVDAIVLTSLICPDVSLQSRIVAASAGLSEIIDATTLLSAIEATTQGESLTESETTAASLLWAYWLGTSNIEE